ERRHGGITKGDPGVILNLHPETFGGRLKKISVPCRTLRVELEIFDLPVLENDELDVLTTDIDDHVDIVVELKSRFGVSHGLYKSDIGGEHILEDILGIAGRADTHDLESRTLILDLCHKLGKDVLRVLNGVSL